MSESAIWNPEDSRLRMLASKIGYYVFSTGMFLNLHELSETKEFLSTSLMLSGAVLMVSPILRECQDYRNLSKTIHEQGDDDDDEGDDWPDDDPEPNPDPTPPGGLHAENELILEIEAFLKDQIPTGVA